MEIRGTEDIPPSGYELYGRREDFFRFVTNMDMTVLWYNNIRTCVIGVEYPLIEEQLNMIDEQLENAEKVMNWNSSGKLSTSYLGKGSFLLCLSKIFASIIFIHIHII